MRKRMSFLGRDQDAKQFDTTAFNRQSYILRIYQETVVMTLCVSAKFISNDDWGSVGKDGMLCVGETVR